MQRQGRILKALQHFHFLHFIGVMAMSALMAGCSNGLEPVNMEDKPLEKPLPINTKPRILAIGQGFSVGIKRDGTVWTWGSNSNRILARNVTSVQEAYEPGQVVGIADAVSVVANSCIFVLMKNGTVWSWGSNRSRQLGYDSDDTFSDVPKKIPGLSDVVDIATSSEAGFALKRDGTVWGWGSGAAGLLGVSAKQSNNGVMRIHGLENIKKIEARHAIDESGRLWIWGVDKNLAGRDMKNKNPLIPGMANIPEKIVDVSVNADAVYALSEFGYLWVWGYNNGGQLGIGDNLDKKILLPVRLSSISGVTHIASSLGAVTATQNFLVTWGVSAGGEPPAAPFPRKDLSVPSKMSGEIVFPIKYLIGGMSAYAVIDSNDDVWFWKDNSRGQRGVGYIPESQDVRYWTTPEKSHWSYK